MRKILTDAFLFWFLVLGCLTAAPSAIAQTINIRSVDTGPYAPGSTIATLVTLTDANGVLPITGNKFELYLSDANGNFATEKLIGSFSGFYTGFVNGIIPQGTPAGTGYKLRVKTTIPASISAASGSFSITAGTAVLAGTATNIVNPAYPEVFGTCNVRDNGVVQYSFVNKSTEGSTVTATFYNDLAQADEGTIVLAGFGTTFNAQAANYTVLVKAVNNGIVGTKAYLLLNNRIGNSFQTQSSATVCLPNNSKASVSYPLNITGNNGLQYNYPGNNYVVNWGDGNTNTLTYAQIAAANGNLKHDYTSSSCGAKNAQGSVTNRFTIAFRVVPPYCQEQSSLITADQAVLSPPQNSIGGPSKACTGMPVRFTNTSFAGQTLSSLDGGKSCEDPNATYQWFVNGQPASEPNLPRNTPLVYTFPSHGTYTVSLKLTSQAACVATDASQVICIQDTPKPDFSLPANLCIGTGAVTPADLSVLDNICSDTYNYKWVVTPATGFTYANGTSATSKAPQFVFNTIGKYSVVLQITNSSCGTFPSPAHTIEVNSLPTAKLAADFALCGKGQTLTFDNNTSSQTYTQLTGTTTPTANTFEWTVTPQGGIGNATFVNGTSANSKYPQINFPDFGTYAVTVKQTNGCGTVTSNVQNITFKEAPTVNAGPDNVICPGSTVPLNGTVNGSYNTLTWSTSGTGTFTDTHALTPVYTPSAADRNAGQVKLKLSITTSLPGDCSAIADETIVTINPSNTITSATSKSICTATSVGYTPTSTAEGSTFNWTVTNSSPNAGGFTASGTGNINDVLTNTSGNVVATVTYTITPVANNCSGTPFNLKVTILPKPQVTLAGPTNNTVCSGSPAGIKLSSNVTGASYVWTVAANGGVSGADNQNTPVTETAINQVLVNNTSAPATVTYNVTAVNSGTTDQCAGDPQSITITVQPAIPAALAGADAVLCNQPSYRLQGNDATPFTGSWTIQSGQTGVVFENAQQYNSLVSGLQPGQTYVFRWTISGASECEPRYDEVTVTNNAPIANNTITQNEQITCAGQTITVSGSTPTGGNGTYKYLWETSTDNQNWIALSGQTAKDLAIQITNAAYFRRSVNSGACTDDKSNVVKIEVQPPISNNTLAPSTINVCINHSAGKITGSTPTGADGNYSYQWQSRTNSTSAWADIVGANSIDYTTPVLTASVEYRRLVSTQVCTGMQTSGSNSIAVVVNPDAKAEFTWKNDAGCVPFVLTAQNIKAVDYPDRNSQYTWYANGQPIGTGLAFPGYTIATDGQMVEIKLEAISKFGCETSVFTHNFTTSKAIKASFTQTATQVCGTTTIQFTNTSTPLGAANYVWNFGNGQTSNQVQPNGVTFAARTDGRDTIYQITLTASSTCSSDIATATITVKPKTPIARIAPDRTSGCAPFTVNINNISPGTNDKYVYHILNASGKDAIAPITSFNKSAQQVTIPLPGDYSIYMEAQNTCNVGRSAPVPLNITQSTLFAGLTTATTAERTGCAPHTVNFINTSQGALSYKYDWGDGSQPTTTFNTNNVAHTFTKEGTYNVVLYANNDCSMNVPSQVIVVNVTAKPQPAFTMDNAAGCNILTVNFTNQTQDPNSAVADNYIYNWDFGDYKSTANNPNTSNLRTPPPHTYDYSHSPYTVTLTVTDGRTGCADVVTKTITVNAPSITDFKVKPDSVITYPNYRFEFEDLTTNNPKSWHWNFGDGSTSGSQNPTHTYADTGLYKVTLTTSNQYCGTTKTHYVRITGTPGQLYVPNAFIPTSMNNDVRTFMAKGSGLASWHMRIYNNYGQMVWETTQLDSKGAPTEGWDGTFRGSPLPQGVYIWQIEASFVNGSQWKGMSYNNSAPSRTGAVNLIR